MSVRSSSSGSPSASDSDTPKSEKPQLPVSNTKSSFLQWNGIHALAIVAATIFGYWGYSLYLNGVSIQSAANMKAALPMSVKLDLSGTGPGMLFMGVGAVIIVVSLLTLKNPKEKRD